MTAVRANWFDDIVVDDDDDVDPFEVHERGLPIEVGDEEARVSRSLQKTFVREGNLENHGVTCEIKDRAETTCWACPVYKPPSSKDPISALCRLGREQDRLITRAAQLRIERKQREQSEEDRLQGDASEVPEAAAIGSPGE